MEAYDEELRHHQIPGPVLEGEFGHPRRFPMYLKLKPSRTNGGSNLV